MALSILLLTTTRIMTPKLSGVWGCWVQIFAAPILIVSEHLQLPEAQFPSAQFLKLNFMILDAPELSDSLGCCWGRDLHQPSCACLQLVAACLACSCTVDTPAFKHFLDYSRICGLLSLINVSFSVYWCDLSFEPEMTGLLLVTQHRHLYYLHATPKNHA